MKKLVIIGIAVLLNGCTATSTPEQIERWSSVCEQNGGVEKFIFSSRGTSNTIDKVYCNNGAIFKEIKE